MTWSSTKYTETGEPYVLCAWGNCYTYLDEKGHNDWGVGAMGCLCDLLPGWRSKWPEGTPKPSVPNKGKGRHGSRHQRQVRRKSEMLRMHEDLKRSFW